MVGNAQNRPVIIWLITGACLVFLMVAVGGITRLTESGLSIVDWNLVMGTIPPLSEEEWEASFEAYKQFPEYQTTHSFYTLSDYKSIFFWEYIHRLLGRIIGIVFIIPFAIFWFQKRLSPSLKKKLIFLLFMGGFQGFLGWYMVSSGLVNEPRVSHLRLAAHLSTAFFTISYSVWLALSLMRPTHREVITAKNVEKWTWFTLGVLCLQIIYGAFVAGKDAGMIHNHWPNMNAGEFIASQAFDWTPFIDNFIDNPSGIQFIHRYLAYVVAGMILFLYVKVRNSDSDPITLRRYKIMVIIVFFQFVLGVLTILYQVPITLGLLHQLGALLLLLSMIYTLNNFPSKKNV